MTDPVYDPIAAFAGTLASLGVRDVVISPGSRSTPLAVTFHAHPALRTHIQLDERSAAFFALGQARASGRPSVLICTSGTAAANYLPAVVEANHSCVPMIVCSADRPPELRDWGAGQTIDQVGIYGTNVRWFADLPVPSDWSESAARLTAMRAHDAAIGPRRGPVHLNWPLRKPLEPVAEVPIRSYETAATSTTEPRSTPADGLFDGDGVIVLGPDAANGIVEGNRCKGKGKGKDRSHPYKSATDPELNNDEGNKGAARAQRWDAYGRAQQSGEPEGNKRRGQEQRRADG